MNTKEFEEKLKELIHHARSMGWEPKPGIDPNEKRVEQLRNELLDAFENIAKELDHI